MDLTGNLLHRIIVLTIIFSCLVSILEGQELSPSDTLIVREIIIEGNFVTSKQVILRELDFKVGEIVLSEEVQVKKQISINNLTKTSLFNFIEISVEETAGSVITVTVKLTERWFIWPTLYLNHTDRNFSEWWRTKDLNKLEYGTGLKINNFRGAGETFMLNVRVGNFTKYELDYRGINLDRAKRHSISLLASYSAKNVLPWGIEFNKQVTLKSDFNLLKSTGLSIKYKYRKGYHNSHSVEFGYSDTEISDTIYSLNPYYEGLNNKRLNYFNLRYEFVSDTRDSRVYPKTGYIFVAGINKKGLGILPDEFKAIDFYTQLFGYRKLSKKFYGASGVWYYANITNDYVFSTQTGLGYLQFVRGYEYYVANGSNALLFKSLLKYEILPMKIINLNIWPIRKLYQFNKIPIEVYANLFFDSGYVTDKFDLYKEHKNDLVNKVMYSFGAGIDFVTYYDKVLRFDYSFNAMGESGLFIHWKAAIR
jgi:outer membrane protein assembly factor BamA